MGCLEPPRYTIKLPRGVVLLVVMTTVNITEYSNATETRKLSSVVITPLQPLGGQHCDARV